MKRLAWLEDFTVLGLSGAIITLWLNLWLGWVLRLALRGRLVPLHLPLLIFVLVLAGAHVTRLALRQPRWAIKRTRLVVGFGGAGAVAVATMLAFPWQFGGEPWYLLPNLGQVAAVALPTFLVHLFAWWNGIHLGRAAIGHHTVAGTFYTGVFALAALLSVNTLNPVYTGRDVLLPVLLYFTLGLCGLALTSLRRLRAQQRSVSLTHVALTRHWVITAMAVIGLVIFVGLVAAQLLAPEAVDQLAQAVGLGLYFLTLGFAVIVAPIFLIIFSLLAPILPRLAGVIRALLDALQRVGALVWVIIGGLRRLLGDRLPMLFTEEQFQQFINSPVVQASGRWGTVFFFLAVAVVIFWLAVRRLGRLSALSEDETRDSVFSMPLLWSQLRNLFQRRRRPAAVPSRYLPLAGAPDDARLIVRRAYQAMLEWALSASLPRAAGQTPRAYAEVLAGAVPQEREAISALTSVYLVARYAAEAPSLEQARSAEGAAAHLRQMAPKAVAHS